MMTMCARYVDDSGSWARLQIESAYFPNEADGKGMGMRFDRSAKEYQVVELNLDSDGQLSAGEIQFRSEDIHAALQFYGDYVKDNNFQHMISPMARS